MEDNPADCVFLFEVLQPFYEVKIVLDGGLAWEMAQTYSPEIVVSDVVLPGLDGFTLARRLRGHPTTAHVPIVLLSASSQIELMVRGLVAGANDVLLKPVRVTELLEVLHAKLVR